MDSRRDRHNPNEIGCRDLLSEQKPTEQHSKRRHQKVIGTRCGRS
jgi:hypothetical protein